MLGLVFAGSVVWIYLGWPLSFRVAVPLILLTGICAGLFAAYFVAKPSERRPVIGIGTGVGCSTLVAAILAIPALTGSDSGDHQTSVSPSPSSTTIAPTSPLPVPDSPPTTPSPDVVLFDDFKSGLSPNNWTLTRLQGSDPKQLPHQIYVKMTSCILLFLRKTVLPASMLN